MRLCSIPAGLLMAAALQIFTMNAAVARERTPAGQVSGQHLNSTGIHVAGVGATAIAERKKSCP